MRRAWGRACLVALSVVALCLPACGKDRPDWNFVVVLTDDMRFDLLPEMPWVHRFLEPKALAFTNAFVTTPLGAPSRASLLAGGYPSKETGVLGNGEPNGGARAFNDNDTLATRLQGKGWTTALIGKYLENYQALGQRIPPGWTSFVNTDSPLPNETYNWSDFQVQRGHSEPDAPGRARTREHETTYMTDYITDQAVRFIERTPRGDPIFLMVNHVAPHEPATPAPEDASEYPDLKYVGRSAGEPDLSDKPRVLTDQAALYDAGAAASKDLAPNMLRSLRSVDRSVRDVMRALQKSGRLDHTVVVFSSDNGYLWGEHKFFGKSVAYEEAIRVPLLVVFPDAKAKKVDAPVAMNLDVPATIAGLSGTTHGSGRDLSVWTRSASAPWRQDLFFQNQAELFPYVPITGWTSLRTTTYKYVEYDVGDRELYDLVRDPLELDNLAEQPGMAQRVAAMSRQVHAQMGLTITGTRFVPATRGARLEAVLSARGGTPPYTWSTDKVMPPGLILASDGRIIGVPKVAGEFSIPVRVVGSKTTEQGGRPQSYTGGFRIRVTP